MSQPPGTTPLSSRANRGTAGWGSSGGRGEYVARLSERVFPGRFSWLGWRVLIESRNHLLADLIRRAKTDIVNDERRRWMTAQKATGALAGFCDLTIGRDELVDHSFLVVGDPGEGDDSQYAVVPHLVQQDGTSFMVILSDVIYPTGENNDYVDCFYRPYLDYRRPIYAIPGNHDWYSLLTGFMWNFCGAEPLPPPTYRLSSYSWQERLARFLWLRPRAPARTLLEAFRTDRWSLGSDRVAGGDEPPAIEGGLSAPAPLQPGPYFAIDLPTFRLVFIDTGASGTLDRDQGLWLCEVSKGDRPKILFTGKPIWTNGKKKPCPIEWEPQYGDPDEPGDWAPRAPQEDERVRVGLPPDLPSTVAEVVAHPDNHYIAAVGGDVHNYQRYPVKWPAGRCSDDDEGPSFPYRTTQYVVSGGGGAFLSPTHVISKLERGAEPCVAESDFRCYPLRGDSLARFSQNSGRRLWRVVSALVATGLLLLWAALNIQNDARDWRDWLDVDRSSWVSSHFLAWLPGGAYTNYDLYLPRAIALLAAAFGIAILLLPWLRLRVRFPIALMAGFAAAYLWGSVADSTPIGTWTLVGAAIVAAISPFALMAKATRRLPARARVTASIALVAATGWLVVSSGFRADFLESLAEATLAVSALAILFVGGPPLRIGSKVLASGAVILTALVLASIHEGWSEYVVGVLSAFLLSAAVIALVLWSGILLLGGKLDADQAARYIAESFSRPGRAVQPVRRAARDVILTRRARWRARSLLPTSRLRRLTYLGETTYSALFDYNDEPLFKHFLRFDVRDAGVTISCLGVVAETLPTTLEDQFSWDPLRGWSTTRAALRLDADDSTSYGEVAFYGSVEGGGRRLTFERLTLPAGTYDVVLCDTDGSAPTRAGDFEWNPDEGKADLEVTLETPPRGRWDEVRLTGPGGNLVGTFL